MGELLVYRECTKFSFRRDESTNILQLDSVGLEELNERTGFSFLTSSTKWTPQYNCLDTVDLITSWKRTWLTGTSPFSIGNTSSFMVEFPLSCLVFGGVLVHQRKRPKCGRGTNQFVFKAFCALKSILEPGKKNRPDTFHERLVVQ